MFIVLPLPETRLLDCECVATGKNVSQSDPSQSPNGRTEAESRHDEAVHQTELDKNLSHLWRICWEHRTVD